MSQPAANRSPSYLGNTARAVDWDVAPVQLPGRQRPRTPLSVVPASLTKRRAPFALLIVFVLLAGLATVLGLNISVSGGQYELVQLRNQQVSLEEANQALTQQVENRQAPQVLAAKAADLGMVASPTFGSIDLTKMTVTGSPKAAVDGSKAAALIAAPDIAPPVPAMSAPFVSAQDATGQDATGQAGAGADSQQAPPAVADVAEKQTDAAKTQVPAGARLNGGSIPAPEQKSGQ